jgi:hypothetical protein
MLYQIHPSDFGSLNSLGNTAELSDLVRIGEDRMYDFTVVLLEIERLILL